MLKLIFMETISNDKMTIFKYQLIEKTKNVNFQ